MTIRDAWDVLHAAKPSGWFVGRPGQRHGGQWEQYAADMTERPTWERFPDVNAGWKLEGTVTPWPAVGGLNLNHYSDNSPHNTVWWLTCESPRFSMQGGTDEARVEFMAAVALLTRVFE